MAWTNLKTDYQDLIWEGLRKYIEHKNPDGTISLEDVTTYINSDEGKAFFGAKDANAMNQAINDIMASGEIVDWVSITEECRKATQDAIKATEDLDNKVDGFITEEKFLRAMPKPTQSGEGALSISDSTDYEVLDLKIDGTTKQNPIRHLNGTVITADKVAPNQVLPTKVESANLIDGGNVPLMTKEYPSVKLKANIKYTFEMLNPDNTTTGLRVGYTHVVKANDSNGGLIKRLDSPSGFTLTPDELNKLSTIVVTFSADQYTGGFEYVNEQITIGDSKGNYTPYVSDLQSAEVSVMGNNILNPKETYNDYGITVSLNSDNTYTINGTATQTVYLAINKAVFLNKSTPYFLTGGSSKANLYVSGGQSNKDTGDGLLIADKVKGKTQEIGMYILGGVEFNNFVLKPMLVIGSQVTAFEPFYEKKYKPLADGTVPNVQSVSPNMTLIGSEGITIDTIIPEPIVNGELSMIGDNGKNLWGDSMERTYKDFNNFIYLPKGTYTVSTENISNASNWRFTYQLKKLDGSIATEENYIPTHLTNNTSLQYDNAYKAYTWGKNSSHKADTITTDNDYLISVGFYYGDTTVNSVAENPMLEEGSVATPYEPYKGQTLTLSQSYELSKWDSIFRDSDGLWKKKVQTGNYTCTADDVKEATNELGCNAMRIDVARLGLDYDTIMLSPIARYVESSRDYKEDTFGWKTLAGLPKSIWWFKNDFTSLETAKKYITNFPLDITYKLAEPIITELPQADQDILNQLVTFYPQTTLTTDEGIVLNVKYLADIEHFVERKFNELSQKTDSAIAEVQALALEG